MTFTYDEDLSQDRDFVRFYTGDTDSASSFLSDEVIASLLAEYATKQEATIAGVRYIIRQLSKPDFQADWLKVDYSSARKGYLAMLGDLMTEFDLETFEGRIGGETLRTYRGDSIATSAPDFAEGRLGDDGLVVP
jgi:hypothetical protein